MFRRTCDVNAFASSLVDHELSLVISYLVRRLVVLSDVDFLVIVCVGELEACGMNLRDSILS